LISFSGFVNATANSVSPGKLGLLKIDRLIPNYVTLVNTGRGTGVFSLTNEGWQLARKYAR
jgi:hypothetical protein